MMCACGFRPVSLLQAIEAVAMDPDGDEEGADSAAIAAANNAGGGGKAQMRRTKQTASFNERQKQPGKGRGGHQQHAQHAPMKSIGVQVGSGLNSTGAAAVAAAATGSNVGEGCSTDGLRQARQRTVSNTGFLPADASEDDDDASDAIGVVHRSRAGVAAAAADGAADRGNKGPAAGPGKPAKLPVGQSGAASASSSAGPAAAAKKQGPAAAATGPASTAAARERRMSTTGAVDVEADTTDGKRAAVGAGSTAVGSSGGKAVAGGAKARRTRASDAADASSSGAVVASRRAALGSPVPEGMVPPLQLGGRQSSSEESGEDESRTGGSTQRTHVSRHAAVYLRLVGHTCLLHGSPLHYNLQLDWLPGELTAELQVQDCLTVA